MIQKYLCWLGLSVTCGCDLGVPPVSAPEVDPVAAAVAAIGQYDVDSDGKISSAEAQRSALDPEQGWDSDGDGCISETEIVERLTTYEALKPGIQSMTCTVLYRGQPLAAAEVIFEPERFLGEAVELATGTTDSNGMAEMVAEEIFKNDPTLRGIRAALYKVRITHPHVKLATDYNAETTLFFELSPMEMVDPPTFRLE